MWGGGKFECRNSPPSQYFLLIMKKERKIIREKEWNMPYLLFQSLFTKFVLTKRALLLGLSGLPVLHFSRCFLEFFRRPGWVLQL